MSLVLAVAGLAGCAPPPDDRADREGEPPLVAEASQEEPKEVREVLRLIDDMPAWAELPPLEDAPDDRNKIEAAAHRIADYDLDAIRRAFEREVDRSLKGFTIV